MNDDLKTERQRLERAWASYVEHKERPNLTRSVTRSWERSSRQLSPLKANTSVDDPRETELEWRDSLLYAAAEPLLKDIERTARDAGYIVAICDGSGKLLWTESSRYMRRHAEAVNFVPGGKLDEASAGTNALDLALRTTKPAKVFSAEHYIQAFHDWVCYSAPVRDPGSGLPLGVLDFSSTWDRANTMGLMTATALARYVEARLVALLPSRPDFGASRLADTRLTLKLLGSPEARLEGRALQLSPRQLEILALLALHPEGLNLDALHTHLYGDQRVSFSTLKAEISVLRGLLKGDIGSRPYRLSLSYSSDVMAVERALELGHLVEALEHYGGQLLGGSESPRLGEWRNFIDSAVRTAVLASGSGELMWRCSSKQPDNLELLLQLVRLLPPNDPRLALVRARIQLLQLED